MSLVLQPQASFTVVRQIPNHLDTDVNYVQAVIRNAYTDAIIDTIQLTSKGGQRFSKNWQVPADSSGQGFYVSIVTSVYSDAGYTTKNGNYGDDENTYLIQDRVNLRSPGGGGADAFTIRKIIKEELDKRKVTFESVTGAIGALQREINRIPKEARWEDVLTAIKKVKEAIPPKVEIPETDFAPVLAAIESAKKAIEEKEVTPEADLTPATTELQNIKTVMVNVLKGLGDLLVPAVQAAIKSEMHNVKWTSSFTTNAEKGETPQAEGPKPQEPVPFDISKLTEQP